MLHNLYCCIIYLATVFVYGRAQPRDQIDQEAAYYLKSFGYMPVLKPGMQADNVAIDLYYADGNAFTNSLKKFQRFAKLPITGKLDGTTKSKMQQPRCGVPDLGGMQMDAINFKWNKPQLTWNLRIESKEVPKPSTRRILSDAFAAWARVIPVTFKEVAGSSKADIEIDFAKRFHEGDSTPFDGPGKVLAHAFYPTDGRVHFDDEEPWAEPEDGSKRKTDLLSVAIHEIGHSLGLSHSTDSDSIMAPFYRKVERVGQVLHRDDVERIQNLYGQREEIKFGNAGFGSSIFGRRRRVFIVDPPTTTHAPKTATTTMPTTTTTTTTTYPRPTPPSRARPTPPSGLPSACYRNIKAALLDLDTKLFVFLTNGERRRVEDGILIPADLSSIYPQLPATVTAAVAIQRTNRVLFFSGRTMYAYNKEPSGNFVLDKSFPKDLSSSISFTPTSAFIWKAGHTIITDGHTFCTFDENWNTCTMTNKIEKYFKLPKNIQTMFTSSTNSNNIVVVTDKGFYDYDMTQDESVPMNPLSIYRC